MTFASPLWLLGLVALPAVLAAYVASRRRAKRYAVRFTAAPALRLAARTVPAWRRHLPAALALAALAALVVSLAKPQKTVAVAVQRASIMLVTDHSGSMKATDVQPNRLAAAQRAARNFLDSLPSGIRVGVVAFSDTPDAVQAPSADHDDARRIIDGADRRRRDRHRRRPAGRHRRPPARPPERQAATVGDRADLRRQDDHRLRPRRRRQPRRASCTSPSTPSRWAASTRPSPTPTPSNRPIPVPPDPDPATDLPGLRRPRIHRRRLRSAQVHLQDAGLATRGQEEPREITASFAIGGLILLLGAGAASLRWAGRLP